MEKGTTQFWVAVISACGLVAAGLLSIFYGDKELQLLMLGGLLTAAGSSASWLFRLNGYASGQADKAALAMHAENVRRMDRLEDLVKETKA